MRKIDQNLRKNEESGTLAHPGLWGWLRPWFRSLFCIFFFKTRPTIRLANLLAGSILFQMVVHMLDLSSFCVEPISFEEGVFFFFLSFFLFPKLKHNITHAYSDWWKLVNTSKQFHLSKTRSPTPKHTPTPTVTHPSPHPVTSIQTSLTHPQTHPNTHHHPVLTHTHKMATLNSFFLSFFQQLTQIHPVHAFE